MRDPSMVAEGQLADTPGTDQCLAFLWKAWLPTSWATALPVLMKPLLLTLVQAALADMPPNSALGADGIPASLYFHFPRNFAPKMTEILQSVFGGGQIPEEWLLGIIRVVPKVPGGIAPEQQRPICLQVVTLKWMSVVILAQLQDFLRLVIPPQ